MNGALIDRRRDWIAVHGLVYLALMGAATSIPVLCVWPLLWVVPLASYAVLVAVVAPLRVTFQPWRFGCVSVTTIAATMAISVGSCSVLVAFQWYASPDLQAYRGLISVSTPGGLLVAGILFSLFNAIFEEIVFRGILFDAVESQRGARVAVLTTAVLFGYCHLRGYPPGPPGVLLAGLYGLFLGGLRVLSGGIGLPVVAHIAADATIFTIVARTVG